MSSVAEQIENLEAILNEGVTEVFVDGQKTVYDLDAIRRRLTELRRQQDTTRRPRTASIDLGNF